MGESGRKVEQRWRFLDGGFWMYLEVDQAHGGGMAAAAYAEFQPCFWLEQYSTGCIDLCLQNHGCRSK